MIYDELSNLGYNVLKHPETSEIVRGFCYYHQQNCEATDNSIYIIDASLIEKDLVNIYPNNIIVVGRHALNLKSLSVNSLIEAPEEISAMQIMQNLSEITATYDEWEKSLLMEVIEHVSLQKFMNNAAQKLTNPLALFDNSLTVMVVAGDTTHSIEGTIWERITCTDMALDDFHSAYEQQKISKAAQDRKKLYIYHPEKDRDHTYLASYIWINSKLYGYMGMIDINNPITRGQQDIVERINRMIKLYFLNNQIYMHVTENKMNLFDDLLNGVDIPEEIINYHLRKIGWKIPDAYYFLTFKSQSNEFFNATSSFMVKKLNRLLPKSIISVFNDEIIMIVRACDYDLEDPNELKKVESILAQEEIQCGVSAVFNDFMKMKFYKEQSSFALECTDPNSDRMLCFYNACHKDHIFRTLAGSSDLHCYCHPSISTLWDSNDEDKRQLVRCFGAYLQNGRNTMATAKALHIHRNTLIYRLNKLSSLLGVELDKIQNSEAFFYMFSCMASEYFG